MSNQVPTLQASVICEDVRQEVNGMQSLVGVLSVIPAANAPIGVLKLCVWSRWTNGLGKFKQTARILAPDGKTVVVEAAVDFELQNANAQATNVHFFAGVQFKEFGLYHVELSLDGKVAIRYPVAIVKVNQNKPAPAAK
jgi:hypothetical protein